MDWVIAIASFVLSFGVVTYSLVDHFKEHPIRKKIDPVIQAELDQSFEWWDREFAKLSTFLSPVPELYPLPKRKDVRDSIKSHYSAKAWALEVENRIADIPAPTPAELSQKALNSSVHVLHNGEYVVPRDLLPSHERAYLYKTAVAAGDAERIRQYAPKAADLYVPSAYDPHTYVPAETRQEKVTAHLAKYGLVAGHISAEGWDRNGYDEYMFSPTGSRLTDGETFIRMRKQWPKDFDYDGLERAWHGI